MVPGTDRTQYREVLASLVGPNLAKLQIVANETQRAPQQSCACTKSSLFPYDHVLHSVLPHFCRDGRLQALKTSLPVHCANLPAAYSIGTGVSKHNELILWAFLPSLTFFGQKIGLR